MLKKILKTCAVIGLILFFFPLGSIAQSVQIKGEFTDHKRNGSLYLYGYFGPQLVLIDSTAMDQGKFTFNRKEPFPRGFYKIGINTKEGITLVLSDESLEFSATLANPLDLDITNSPENTAFLQFARYNQKVQQQNMSLGMKARNLAAQSADPETQQKITDQMDSLRQVQTVFLENLAETYGDLYVGKIAHAMTLTNKEPQNTFFSAADLTDDELTRSDLLMSKVMGYFQRFVERDLASWAIASDELIQLTKANSPQREVFYLSLVNLYANGAPDRLWDITKKYGNDFPESKHYKYLVSLLPPPSPEIGDQAPDIVLPDPEGNLYSLSELKGKHVLVDFWASWCGPCRMENPNVVKAYQKYKDHGFTILGVSLDQDKTKWLSAIEKDNLTWDHISDLKGWKNEGAMLYQVRSIPASFLVGPNGKIIAKNLRGKALDKTLEKLLIK